MEFGSNDWYRFEKKAKTYPAEIFVRFVFIHRLTKLRTIFFVSNTS